MRDGLYRGESSASAWPDQWWICILPKLELTAIEQLRAVVQLPEVPAGWQFGLGRIATDEACPHRCALTIEDREAVQDGTALDQVKVVNGDSQTDFLTRCGAADRDRQSRRIARIQVHREKIGTDGRIYYEKVRCSGSS